MSRRLSKLLLAAWLLAILYVSLILHVNVFDTEVENSRPPPIVKKHPHMPVVVEEDTFPTPIVEEDNSSIQVTEEERISIEKENQLHPLELGISIADEKNETYPRKNFRYNGLRHDRISSSYGHYRWKVVGTRDNVIYRVPIPSAYWYDDDYDHELLSKFLAEEKELKKFAEEIAMTFDTIELSSVPKISRNPKQIYSVHDTFKGPELESEWKWVQNISIVYTWINGSESNHITKKMKFLNERTNSRDKNNNELLYSLRSLEKAMPWHKGTIFIVSPKDHIPNWLNTKNRRIVVIDQESLVPKKYLPTFNTNCIEAYLDKVPGITERFIFMNDEYFINAAYLHPSAIFDKYKHPRFYFVKSVMFSGCDEATNAQNSENEFFSRKISCKWMKKSYNRIRKAGLSSAELLDKTFVPRFRYYNRHSPFIFYRDALTQLRTKFPKRYRENCQHRKRHTHDLLTPVMHNGFVIEMYENTMNGGSEINEYDKFAYCLPSEKEATSEARLIMVRDKFSFNKRRFDKLLNKLQPYFFTMNDDFQQEKTATQLREFLESWFAIPSSFEKKKGV